MAECPNSVAGGGGDAVGNDVDHKPAPKPTTRAARNKREHKPRLAGHPWAVDKVHEGPPQGLSITAPPLGGDKGTQHK